MSAFGNQSKINEIPLYALIFNPQSAVCNIFVPNNSIIVLKMKADFRKLRKKGELFTISNRFIFKKIENVLNLPKMSAIFQ